MSIYKDCDIRGIYPSEIREDEVKKIGRALATICGDKPIAVGGDVRTSTPALKEALIEGMLLSGGHVIDLGTIPTPALYYSLKQMPGCAGATVTASHNPPEYNGVKFMLDDKPVTRESIDRVKSIAEAGAFADAQGTYESKPAADGYLSAVKSRFKAIKPLHVLVDAGNGALSEIAPAAFRAAGYRVTELFCAADGTFPNRAPNPSEYKNLKKTEQAVRDSGADFGVAFDGDGDRVVFLDETGAPVQNEKALVLFIRHLLKNRPTAVVYDQKSSSVVRDAALEMGGTPMPERSGHAFIKRRFLENRAAVAGEVSGHFFFGELGYDDGLFAALSMAELIAGSGRTLSALTENIVCPPITPDIRFFCRYAEQSACLEKLESMAVREGAVISRLDGVRAEFEFGWLLVRKSVTAEQITLRAEAKTRGQLEWLIGKVAEQLPPEAGETIRQQL